LAAFEKENFIDNLKNVSIMPIRKVELKDKEELEELANKYLVPLYGDQTKALNEWLTGYNYKHAWVFEADNGEIEGLVAVSDKPDKNYVKLSTLVVKEEYLNKGIGKSLLEVALEYAKKSGKKEISVTVGEDVEDSFHFFKKYDFKLKKELQDKYREGKKELVLVREIK